MTQCESSISSQLVKVTCCTSCFQTSFTSSTRTVEEREAPPTAVTHSTLAPPAGWFTISWSARHDWWRGLPSHFSWSQDTKAQPETGWRPSKHLCFQYRWNQGFSCDNELFREDREIWVFFKMVINHWFLLHWLPKTLNIEETQKTFNNLTFY